MKARNKILADIVSALGGSVTDINNRNKLIADIVIAAGGTVTNINDRNQLLQDWLDAYMVDWYNRETGMVTCSNYLLECNSEQILCL